MTKGKCVSNQPMPAPAWEGQQGTPSWEEAPGLVGMKTINKGQVNGPDTVDRTVLSR